MRGLEFPRRTMPPAARIGAWPFAESVMANLCRTRSRRASRDLRDAAERQGNGASGDDYDDLTEVLVGVHLGEGVDDIGKLVGFVDRQAELAALDRRPQIGAHGLDDVADLFGRAGAEGDADIVDALERVQVEVELAHRAAETPYIDDTPEQCRSFEIADSDGRRDHVDDEVGAIAAGCFFDVLRPIRLAGVDRNIAIVVFELGATLRIG